MARTAPRWLDARASALRLICAGLTLLAAGLLALPAQAIPTFARQTGQNCVACHAGGQFPELTPYGRLFKMTGYTIGERTMPLSAMAVATVSKVANTSKSPDPGADFQKNGALILATGSAFLGGKVSDNLGGFAQFTYDPYDNPDGGGLLRGHAVTDNVDLRYADRFFDLAGARDLIVGVSLNNNPSVSDPWNTAAAWMQYVPVPSPSSSRFIDGNAPYPGYSAGGGIAGLSAYAFWNRSVYAEFGAYRTARGVLSILHGGSHDADVTKLSGFNPYARLAYNHEWGPNALMLGASGMVSHVADDPLDPSAGATRHTDASVDAMYQYLLDPHSVTAQAVLSHSSDASHVLRTKLTYVYQAKYGGSVGSFALNAPADAGAATTAQAVDGSAAGSASTRGLTFETFYTPIQYVRIGLQYTAYTRFNGASRNYDGFGRNASDNNTLFLYTWLAY
ncbi:MAG: cytochrome C [Leptothrix sp. (in: b-proteobacteria)]